MKYLGYIRASLFRKKIRLFLTIATIFIAFLLFGVLQGIGQVFKFQAGTVGSNRLFVGAKYSFIDPLPLAYKNQIENVPGVELVSNMFMFSGVYQDPKNSFPQFVVSPETYFDIYDELIVPPEQLKAFQDGRTGVAVGKNLADRFGWKLGDKIPLINELWVNRDGSTWEFEIVAIFEHKDPGSQAATFVISYDYFNEYSVNIHDLVGIFIVKIAAAHNANRIGQTIDTLFANSQNETKTTTEKEWAISFAKQLGDIDMILFVVISAVFFALLFAISSSIAQTYRERISELAVMKTLGFDNTTILLLMLTESMLIAVSGALLGLLCAKGLLEVASAALKDFLPRLVLSGDQFFYGLLLAAVTAIVASVPSVVKALKLNVIDAIREGSK